MDFKQAITDYSIKHYKLVTVIMVVLTLGLGALIPLIKVDTDPENMLSADEPVRVFHNQTKKQFALSDIVVVGIVNDKDTNGVFNPSSLSKIYELTEFAKTLRWQDEENPDKEVGIIEVDILAPSTVDHIGQGRPGEVKFEWLMRTPPATQAEALEIRDKAMSNPLLKGTVISEDGKAICLYLPLTSKDLSYRVYSKLRENSTMGLSIGLGYPVHIMSSMIPIFLMPIAVVDSVHILSEFFDLYTSQKGQTNTTREVMGNLFMPMLYTSLTSAAGFASLALTPIPPVQVFGIFVAIGIMIAWVCTITFVPAYIMMIKESSLANFGIGHEHTEKQGRLGKLLGAGGHFTYNKAKPILLIMLLITAVAIYGITQIQINDNPVKWFSKSHPIRQADIELNKHFGGTYMAYLVLDEAKEEGVSAEYINDLRNRLVEKGVELKDEFPQSSKTIAEVEKALLERASAAKTKVDLLNNLSSFADKKVDTADEKEVDIWYELADFFELEKEKLKIFKQPEVLEYIAALQNDLEQSGLVGKSNSVADVVKKVHQELVDGKPESYIIPDSSSAVAQCLLQFQSSHNPDDLWHLVTYDYMHANIWLQLTSGDNKDAIVYGQFHHCLYYDGDSVSFTAMGYRLYDTFVDNNSCYLWHNRACW